MRLLYKSVSHYTNQCWGWTTIILFFCPPPFQPAQPSQYWVQIVVVMLFCSMLEIYDVICLLYCIVLRCVALRCFALRYVAVQCIVLYCFVINTDSLACSGLFVSRPPMQTINNNNVLHTFIFLMQTRVLCADFTEYRPIIHVCLHLSLQEYQPVAPPRWSFLPSESCETNSTIGIARRNQQPWF